MSTGGNSSFQNNKTKPWGALLLIAIPPAIFYYLLLKSQTSIPFSDDYGSVLDFMLKLKHENLLGKFVLILTAQHMEYRLAFQNAIFALQYGLLGHSDVRSLSLLGNLFVLPICGVLYLLWRASPNSRITTLVGFVPVSWLLFQLQYASALNCAMSALQNLAVVLFALLSIYLGSRPTSAAFGASCLSLVLAVASSGNGLFLIPVGAVMLLQRHEFKRFAVWVLVGSFLCIGYFYGYDYNSRQSSNHGIFNSLTHISPIWASSFLGSIATIRNVVPAVALGVALVILFFWATRDRLFDRNPAVYYAMLFFLLTAIMVSGIRSDLGLVNSLQSHYRITSTMMIVLAYIYISEKLSVRMPTSTVGFYLLMTALLAFTLLSDRAGYKLLLLRRTKLEESMYRWEQHLPRPTLENVNLNDEIEMNMAAHESKGVYDPIEPTLSDSISAGIYRLPQAEINQGAPK